MTSSYVEYWWTFDNTFRDLSSTFIETTVNGPRFNSSTITGYGSSLSLSSAANQSVVMDTPFLNLSTHSWTFEAWIYPFTLLDSIDYGIIGQCENFGPEKCLHLNIRHQKLYIGFNYDDLAGMTSLIPFKWYHIAFVFNSVNRNQSIYLNGVLDNSRKATSAYLGNRGKLTFGLSTVATFSGYFDGLIDQVYYTNRAKNLTEILDDATLTFYFPFDCGSLHDQGPLRINGSLFGSEKFVVGRKGNALQFDSAFDSYFRVNGLVLLGTSDQSYSMSIWINPTAIKNSSIIHVSTERNSLGSWCVGMLGLTSSGQLVAFSPDNAAVSVAGPILKINSWVHAAITYSTSNGLRLYVDGTLQNSSHPFRYSVSDRPNYLFLANSFDGSNCIGMRGPFFSALDEFRLYSRELNAHDVSKLSQPES